MFWVAEREEEAMFFGLLSVSEQGWLQNVTENEEVSTGLLCFQTSASASVYKDHDEEADTRIMRRSALDNNIGAPFDGTPFDGTPFDRLGTPFEGATF